MLLLVVLFFAVLFEGCFLRVKWCTELNAFIIGLREWLGEEFDKKSISRRLYFEMEK